MDYDALQKWAEGEPNPTPRQKARASLPERRFLVTLRRFPDDPIEVRAKDRQSARFAVIKRDIEQGGVTLIEARKAILSCKIHPDDAKKRGPKPGGRYVQPDLDPDDHIRPHF